MSDLTSLHTHRATSQAGQRAHGQVSVGVLLVVAFISGLAGAAIGRITMVRRLGPLSAFIINGPHTAADAHNLAARLGRRLDLTPDQEHQVDTIIAHRLTEVGAIRDQVNNQLMAIIVAGQTEIDSVLTPPQRAKFLDMRRRKGVVDSTGRPVLIPPH
jgi:hypothetical protein